MDIASPNAFLTRSTLVVAALAGGLAMMFAGAASAESVRAAPAASVAYSDLDLSRPEAARVMLARLHAAARDVCGTNPLISPVLPRAAANHRACIEGAVDRAVADLGAPLLVALHTGQSPVAATLASR